MRISSSVTLRLTPILVIAVAVCSSASAASAQTRRQTLRGARQSSQTATKDPWNAFEPGFVPRHLPPPPGLQAPAAPAAVAAAPSPGELEKPPELMKDIPEPPPPPAQPPAEPPIPPLPPTEGTLVGLPPPLPYWELSIHPESATASEDPTYEEIAAKKNGVHIDGGDDTPIAPPHVPIHAADLPPEPPNMSMATATTTQTLFPQQVIVVPSDCSGVPTTTISPLAPGEGCAKICHGVCVEQKTRALDDGAVQQVDAHMPCQDGVVAAPGPSPAAVVPLAVPNTPPPLPAIASMPDTPAALGGFVRLPNTAYTAEEHLQLEDPDAPPPLPTIASFAQLSRTAYLGLRTSTHGGSDRKLQHSIR